jgi:hypothetical protein
MVNEPTLIPFKEQSVSTPNKFFAKKKIQNIPHLVNLNFERLLLAPGFSRVNPVIMRIKPVSTGFSCARKPLKRLPDGLRRHHRAEARC